jgi:hypothetical protein
MDFFRNILSQLVWWYVKNEQPKIELFFSDSEVDLLPIGRSVKVTFEFSDIQEKE